MNIDTVLLDRDGVINEVVIRGDNVSSPRKFSEFLFVKEIYVSNLLDNLKGILSFLVRILFL